MHPLAEKVGDIIRAQNFFPGSGNIIVAVSGGIDSMALLHLLAQAQGAPHARGAGSDDDGVETTDGDGLSCYPDRVFTHGSPCEVELSAGGAADVGDGRIGKVDGGPLLGTDVVDQRSDGLQFGR